MVHRVLKLKLETSVDTDTKIRMTKMIKSRIWRQYQSRLIRRTQCMVRSVSSYQ